MRLAVTLFVLCALNHITWHLVADELKGMVFQMGGAFGGSIMLLVVWAQNVQRAGRALAWALTAVCVLYQWENVLVVACGAWHLIDPLLIPAPKGEELCRSRVGFRMLNISLVATGFVGAMLLDRLRSR